MLELNPANILCGTMLILDEATHLYCNPETGTVAYEDPDGGNIMCIGEMSLADPLELHDVSPYVKGLTKGEYAGAVGLVFTRSGVVYAIMDDYTAEIRKIKTMREHSDETLGIDINQDYDEMD